MSNRPDAITDDRETRQLMESFGQPFAKALATFVAELRRREANGVEHPADHTGATEDRLPRSWEDLPIAMRQAAEAEIRENEVQLAEGRISSMEFTEDSPAVAAANRLRRTAERKGVSQRELARKLNVSPSVISKVFQNPDRSKVATLRRIAAALQVELAEIV